MQSAVRIGHRLVAGLDVHNAETAVAKANTSRLRIDEDALIVRSAMREHVAHTLQHATSMLRSELLDKAIPLIPHI
jgi:hypothetical protein